MAQIYIASPFFSPEQVTRVTQLEEALAKNPTVGFLFTTSTPGRSSRTVHQNLGDRNFPP